jgi:hypothetical protein
MSHNAGVAFILYERRKGQSGGMIMRTRTTAWVAVSAALLMSAGCGEREDYRERFIKLQAEHGKETAKLEAMYTAQIESYKQKLASREKELRTQSSEMAEMRKLLSTQKIRHVTSALSARELTQKKTQVTAVQPGAQPGGPAEAASTGISAIPENISTLEQFVSEYENSIEEGRRDKYQKDFGAFLAQLRAQAQKEPVQRKKERTIGSLRERIDAETDADEKELLENRLAKIESARPEDIEATLNYYQQLDNNQELNRLMNEYTISRDELRDYGITPPPRTRWGPDVKEIANNLNSFVENYTPLVPEGQREQYQKDFNDFITNFTTRPTDAQVIQSQNQMIADLKAQYAAAPESDKQRIQRRLQRLETADLDSLRQRLQLQNTRGIQEIADKYNIPRSELQQSGVVIPRGRRAQ